jgi:hypothetical protein
VASSSSSYLCLKRRRCGAERGEEADDDDFVVVVKGRGKRLGGKVGRGATDDGKSARGEHVVIFVIVVDLDPGSVNPPLPRA